jgi:hypothetical protein
LVVLLRNYVTMMHGQQNIKNGWATIVVVGRLRVNIQNINTIKSMQQDREPRRKTTEAKTRFTTQSKEENF